MAKSRVNGTTSFFLAQFVSNTLQPSFVNHICELVMNSNVRHRKLFQACARARMCVCATQTVLEWRQNIFALTCRPGPATDPVNCGALQLHALRRLRAFFIFSWFNLLTVQMSAISNECSIGCVSESGSVCLCDGSFPPLFAFFGSFGFSRNALYSCWHVFNYFTYAGKLFVCARVCVCVCVYGNVRLIANPFQAVGNLYAFINGVCRVYTEPHKRHVNRNYTCAATAAPPSRPPASHNVNEYFTIFECCANSIPTKRLKQRRKVIFINNCWQIEFFPSRFVLCVCVRVTH